MVKVACLNPIAKVGLDLFSDKYEIVEKYEDANAVLVRSAAMHELPLGDELLAIGRAGAGVNNIPLQDCAEKGIVVFNAPGANANGVKELVIAAMMLGARDIIGGVNWVQTVKSDENVGKLVEKGKKQFAGTEIMGKKLGVIGLGAIGYRVANAAVDLGMEVYGYNPDIPVDYAWNLSHKVKHIYNLDEIFANCDYITLHVPLNDGTRGMLNKDAFAKMKDGVVILNFARDPLADDDALAEALAAGKVKRYITDFPNYKTANMEGVIAIPHLGASTRESEDNCAIMAVKELQDYIDNGNIVNSVNYPNCSLGKLNKPARVCIAHRNLPNTLSKFSGMFGDAGLNIYDMISKSKGEYSYAMFDLDHAVDQSIIDRIMAMEGVLKVRLICNE